MATAERRSLAERTFYAICIGASGAVVVGVVSFAFDLPLLATFGSPSVALTVLSTLFGVPTFWVFSRRPDVTVPRRAVNAVLAGAFGLIVAVSVLVALLVSKVPLPGVTTAWMLFVVGGAAVVGVPAYVILKRGVHE